MKLYSHTVLVKSRILCMAATAFALSILIASGQKPAILVVSPVPPLPADPTTAPAGQKVFIDFAKKQIVVLLPDSGSAVPVQRRFDLTNQTDSTLTFSIRSDGSGTYTYSYLIQPSASRRSAARLTILIPPGNAGLVSVSGALAFQTQPTDLPNHLIPAAGYLQMISWSAPVPGAGVENLALALKSTYLPGFSDVYLQSNGANPLTAATAATFPPDVGQQIQPFLRLEWNSIRASALIPMFRPGTSPAVIAPNFHFGISVLTRRGALIAGNPFVTELTANLNSYIGSGMVGSVIPASAPDTPLEQTILQALQAAFSK